MIPKQAIILLDEGWDATPYVAVGLRNAGCAVHIVTSTLLESQDVTFLGPAITREAVPPVGSETYIRAIEAAIASRPTASVLALTEAILYRIWDANPCWQQRLYPVSSPWQQELLRDKARLSDYVGRAGIRIPAQRSIPSAASVGPAIQALGLPVVVKGGVGVAGSSVRIASTAEEAVAAANEISKRGNCFLQEHISGPTFLVGGLFHDGKPIRIYSGEKIESAHPTGPSLRLRSECDPALISLALAAFRALRWSGLAAVDIMRGRDGNYYFLEFNPRPWGSIGAAAQAGVNFFHPLASLLSGQMPTPNLYFARGMQTTLFPQVAKARVRRGGIRSLACMVREPRIWLSAPWHDPGLAVHLARQVWWSWLNGTRASKSARLASTQPEPGMPTSETAAAMLLDGMGSLEEN